MIFEPKELSNAEFLSASFGALPCGPETQATMPGFYAWKMFNYIDPNVGKNPKQINEFGAATLCTDWHSFL